MPLLRPRCSRCRAQASPESRGAHTSPPFYLVCLTSGGPRFPTAGVRQVGACSRFWRAVEMSFLCWAPKSALLWNCHLPRRTCASLSPASPSHYLGRCSCRAGADAAGGRPGRGSGRACGHPRAPGTARRGCARGGGRCGSGGRRVRSRAGVGGGRCPWARKAALTFPAVCFSHPGERPC